MPFIIDSYSETNVNSYGTQWQNHNVYFGQTFVCSTTAILDSAQYWELMHGSVTGNLYMQIYAITGTPGAGALPTGSALATSDNVAATSIGTSYSLITFNFSGANRITLAPGNYCVVSVSALTGGDDNNQIREGCDTTSPTHGGNSFDGDTIGGCTARNTQEIAFYVYGDNPVNSNFLMFM